MQFLKDDRPYVIAEIGANHNGDMEQARAHIRAAKAAGADAAKFQSWGTGLFAQSVYDANAELKEAVAAYAVAESDMAALAEYCRKTEIDFASTPCSATEIVELDALDPPFVKIASMDLNNDRMLIDAAKTGRPIILSTGFSSMAEIEHALTTLESENHTDIVLLHCIALYPPPGDDLVNLRNIEMLRDNFGYPVGYSDHTIGVEVTLAAIALGAAVIEKHFTLDKALPGWDHAVSADPSELAIITTAARRIPAALGSRRRIISEGERQNAQVMRRSIVAAHDIRSGEILTEEHLEFRRPGTGISPNDAGRLLGGVARRDIAADTLLSDDDVERAPSQVGRAA
ncbi:MAG: N-acetylneuraminate synthase family protein [Alphaproteobacteria bacterium]